MIYRLRYCNKEGVEARIDIQEGLATPVIEVEGTERPFILSYNNDKGDKSGMFLSSSADIEIYETPEFNIDNLKTSNETELSVTHYIDNVISWQGFIIPDFFSIEVRNNPVIAMTASDRIGTLKNVTLSDLPSMISLRELAVLCLNKTGLTLPLKTMADFQSDVGANEYFRSHIPSQRLYDNKGRSISCYDILRSILIASGSKLMQYNAEWYIINKLQHEGGVGRLYSTDTAFTSYLETVFNFSEITKGAMRSIVPVAGSVGIYHEHGGGKLHPDNYDFSQGLTGWTPVNGFDMGIEDRQVKGYKQPTPGYPLWEPDFGEATDKNKLANIKNENAGFSGTNLNERPYVRATVPIVYADNTSEIEISANISITSQLNNSVVWVLLVERDSTRLGLTLSGAFEPFVPTEDRFKHRLSVGGEGATENPTEAAYDGVVLKKGTLSQESLAGFNVTLRIYGSGPNVTSFVNFASISFKSTQETAKGVIYKREQGSDFTKAHDIDTVIFGDYLTGGLNGYFYPHPIDDTSSIYKPAGGLQSKWTTPYFPTETDALPLLQHVVRQQARMFSVAHDLISGEIEMSEFDPLSIFIDCNGKRHVIVSASFDFLRSSVRVELEEIAYDNLTVRDFIYSYFGDGESGIKSIGGISGGSGGGGTGGGLTPEQLEILSFWKKDPDRENTISTEMNAYSKLELSAYGIGSGGGPGGGIIETVHDYSKLGQTFNNANLTDTFNAYTINQINTRLVAVESGSDLTVNTTGTGNAITSITKAGSVITANKDLTFSLSDHLHTGVYEPVFSKNTAFNKNFGAVAGTVAEGNHTHTFASLTSKPTTLGEYGITDAVTLNTAQTISGAKTFSDGLNIEGALNVTGVGGYAEGIRLHPVAGLSSIWFNAIENTGFQSGMFGMTVNASGMRFRYGTGVSPNDLMMILNNGNVGIGISSPQYKLDVSGTGNFTGTITAPLYKSGAYNWASKTMGFYSATDGHTTGGFSIYDGTGTTANFYRQDNLLILGRAGNQSLTIDTNSNVNILGNTTTPKVIFNSAGWSMEQVGSELQMKHNNVLKMRFTSTGAIVATNEITAFA